MGGQNRSQMMSGKVRSSLMLGDEESELQQKLAHKVYMEPRVLLIKPTVDASDKELHRRNDMLNAEKNLRKYLNQ